MKKYICTVKCWHSRLGKMFRPGDPLEAEDGEMVPTSFAAADEAKPTQKKGGKTDAAQAAPTSGPAAGTGSGPQGPNPPPPATGG